jgi:hypothetical protein
MLKANVCPNRFTAAELKSLEVLARLEDCKDCSLSRPPIHPAFARKKWKQDILPKHLARYPLGEGREGFWDVVRVLPSNI